MIEAQAVPPYVYKDDSCDSLSQGDVLKVDGKFREKFKEYYPSINHPDDEEKYVLVLTQSCDLVKVGKRKPKLPHINVCLVRTLEAVIKKIIDDEAQPDVIGGKKLLLRDAMDKLKDRLLKLLNNNDQKIHFFLPKKTPFKEDMIALLHMSFSFRTDEHYDELLQNRVLSLKPEFQAKLGHVISQLYGRIATPDLSDFEWKDKSSRRYINDLLEKVNLTEVPDSSFIKYIKAKYEKEHTDIEKLIEECQASKFEEKFKPLKNELIQDIRNRLINALADPLKVRNFEGMSKEQISKEITKIIKSTT